MVGVRNEHFNVPDNLQGLQTKIPKNGEKKIHKNNQTEILEKTQRRNPTEILEKSQTTILEKV